MKKITLVCNISFTTESDRTMDDKELTQQVLNGNNHAFRFLVQKHQRLVLHIVGRMLHNQADIEDVCQDVFIRVFRKMNHFRGESRMSTWIATIAYNTCISHIQKGKRKMEDSYDERPALVTAKGDGEKWQRKTEQEDIKKYLMELIESLPLHYRTVLTLFHLDGFSYKEIEQITGMPEGTIKSYLSRARNILRERLEMFASIEKIDIFEEYAS